MARLLRSHPVLAVPDVERTAAWFEAVLGCGRDEVDPGNWIFVGRDGIVVLLGRCPDAIPPGDLGDHQSFAYFVVDDVDAVHARAVGAIEDVGGAVLKAPTDEPWGMREMALRTVDGHRLMVGTNLEPVEPPPGKIASWPAE